MAITLKYQSRQRERNENGFSTTLVWTGTREEVEAFAAEETPGTPADDGTLESVRIYQDGGNIWAVERRYSQDQNGDFRNKPNVVYGKKSAQLHGSMLSLPLEANPKYKTQWNYFLASAPGITAVPAFWETATDPVLTSSQSQQYAWIRSTAELPTSGSDRWSTMKKPKYPGVNSYDVATYTVTETAKFKSAKAAGTMIAGKLNQIGKPDEDFGMTPSGYNWKCDDATVSYNGGDWYATLTWTRSGDNKGWNTDLYGGGN